MQHSKLKNFMRATSLLSRFCKPREPSTPPAPTRLDANHNGARPIGPSALAGARELFNRQQTPTFQVLHFRGGTVAADKLLAQQSTTLIGRHYQAPGAGTEYARQLLAEVNRLEVAAEDKPEKEKARWLRATEAVKVLMGNASFKDTPDLRAAIEALHRLQKNARLPQSGSQLAAARA